MEFQYTNTNTNANSNLTSVQSAYSMPLGRSGSIEPAIDCYYSIPSLGSPITDYESSKGSFSPHTPSITAVSGFSGASASLADGNVMLDDFARKETTSWSPNVFNERFAATYGSELDNRGKTLATSGNVAMTGQPAGMQHDYLSRRRHSAPCYDTFYPPSWPSSTASNFQERHLARLQNDFGHSTFPQFSTESPDALTPVSPEMSTFVFPPRHAARRSSCISTLGTVPEPSSNQLTPTQELFTGLAPGLFPDPSITSSSLHHDQPSASWATMDPAHFNSAQSHNITRLPHHRPPPFPHQFPSYYEHLNQQTHLFPTTVSPGSLECSPTLDDFFQFPPAPPRRQSQAQSDQPLTSVDFTNSSLQHFEPAFVFSDQAPTNFRSTSSKTRRMRRKSSEIERIYACNWLGCDKAYGVLNHLNTHVRVHGHGEKRDPSEFKEVRKQYRQRRESAASAGFYQYPTKHTSSSSDASRPSTSSSTWSDCPSQWFGESSTHKPRLINTFQPNRSHTIHTA